MMSNYKQEFALTKEANIMEYPVLDAKATGARIKEIRKAHHIKVEEIARFMGYQTSDLQVM